MLLVLLRQRRCCKAKLRPQLAYQVHHQLACPVRHQRLACQVRHQRQAHQVRHQQLAYQWQLACQAHLVSPWLAFRRARPQLPEVPRYHQR